MEKEQETLFFMLDFSLVPVVRISFEHCINSSSKPAEYLIFFSYAKLIPLQCFMINRAWSCEVGCCCFFQLCEKMGKFIMKQLCDGISNELKHSELYSL